MDSIYFFSRILVARGCLPRWWLRGCETEFSLFLILNLVVWVLCDVKLSGSPREFDGVIIIQTVFDYFQVLCLEICS